MLEGVGVIVNEGATASVSTQGVKSQSNSYIVVDGTMNWTSGDVNALSTIGPAGSHLAISQTGKFNVTAADAMWGGGVASDFQVLNYGIVTVDAAGVSTIRGSYLNNGGTTIKQGTLKITGKVEQENGAILLQGRASIDVTAAPDATLHVYDGSIEGDGTVLGTLSLGKATQTHWSEGGQVLPGEFDANGQRMAASIDVTADFKMLSSGCMVAVFVNSAGGVSKLAVAGTATLKGGINISWHPAYNPPAGTSKTVVSWGSVVGDFDGWILTYYPWWIDGNEHQPSLPSGVGATGVVVTVTVWV